jgi:DNA-binding SARP family transcriptional activator/tetratricopeptide (TPR) repeat protein
MDFRILGPLEVLEEDRPVVLGGVKLRALLVVLVLHPNETLSSERLIDELWGECPPANATKAVQMRISRLRGALDAARHGAGNAVVTRDHGYYLRTSPESVDSIRFERLVNEGRSELAAGRAARAAVALESGLSLWRGPPLADFVYEPFAQAEIARLTDLRIAALEELVEAKLALGRHAEVVGVLEPLIGEHPYRERLRGQLMLALYRCERQAEALQAYQDARRTLVGDLGIEPGERLRELERGILAQDPALAIGVDPRDGSEAMPESRSAAFIGRDYEFGELLMALGHASAGRGRLVVLAGEPGIGKTRLVDELIAHAKARGVRTLVGRCWEAGGAPPYWPWVQSLRTFVRDSDVAVLRSLVVAGSAELAQILPELRHQLPDLPEPAEVGSEGARFRLFEATAAFLRAASEKQPILLFLDDLHGADASSLLLLRFLARELDSMRVLVVVAHRNVDPTPTPALAEALGDVAREPITRRYSLAGWTRREVAECVENAASGLASSELVAELHEKTGGNPLFIGEIVRLLAIEGVPVRTTGDVRLAIPESVRDVISRRLSHLSAVCHGLLVLASVIGREFAFEELAHAGSISQDDLVDVLDEPIAAGVLAEVRGAPGRLRFAHTLLRDTLYEDLTSLRRVRLHRRIVETLETLYGEDPWPHLAELAHHSSAGNEPDKAGGYARRAADRAMALFAYDEATGFYEMALSALELREPPAPACERVELARQAAEAANLAGDHRRAARIIRAALPAVDHGDDPERVGLLHERLGRYLWAAGDSESALAEYDQAVTLVPSNTPSHARARTLAARGQSLMLMARYRESQAVCEAAIAMAVGVGARAEEGHALNTLGLDLAYLGEVDAGVSGLLEARRVAEEVGDRDDIGRAYLNLSHLLAIAADQPDEALRIALDGIEVARRLGLASDYGVSLQANAASALVAVGRWREADEMLEQAEELHPNEIARADLLHARVELLGASGRHDAAEVDLDELQRCCAQVVDPQHHAPLCARIAELALWRGDPEAAGAAVVTGLAYLEETDDLHYIGPLLSLGMRAAADTADPARATPLLERARNLAAGKAPLPLSTTAHISLCEAEAARLANEPDAERWRAARAVWEAVHRPYPAAYSAWREAETLLTHGRERRSVEAALRYSHRVALRLGAAPLLTQLELLGDRAACDFEGRTPTVSAG